MVKDDVPACRQPIPPRGRMQQEMMTFPKLIADSRMSQLIAMGCLSTRLGLAFALFSLPNCRKGEANIEYQTNSGIISG